MVKQWNTPRGANYELLLFDADGTLFDYDKAEEWALAGTLKKFKLTEQNFTSVLSIYQEINHALWKALERGEVTAAEIRVERFRTLLERLNFKADPVAMGETYLTFLGSSGFLIDGTFELLDTLKENFKLALITNGITDTQYGRLKASGIDRYFDPIIISGEVGSQKPETKIFEVLFDQAGFFDKNKALIIGDSLTSDMQGGINFGIDTCWFNPENKPRTPNLPITYEVSSLDEITHIVLEKESR